MKTRIDRRIKRIMALKERVGEFSLDLYYNNLDDINPYVAKLSGPKFNELGLHYRAKSFLEALDDAERFLKIMNYDRF